jgi:hypothetical protein
MPVPAPVTMATLEDAFMVAVALGWVRFVAHCRRQVARQARVPQPRRPVVVFELWHEFCYRKRMGGVIATRREAAVAFPAASATMPLS